MSKKKHSPSNNIKKTSSSISAQPKAKAPVKKAEKMPASIKDVKATEEFWKEFREDIGRHNDADGSNQAQPAFQKIMRLVLQFKADNPSATDSDIENSMLHKIIQIGEAVGVLNGNDYNDIWMYLIGNSDTLEAGCRFYLRYVYYGFDGCYKGTIIKLKSNLALFRKIDIDGAHSDGTGFRGSEDHVWISDKESIDALKQAQVKEGDCISFSGDVVKYTRKNGLTDYKIQSLSHIKKIEEYDLPSEDELLRQAISDMVCNELCLFTDHCDRFFCIAADGWREKTISEIMESVKKPKKSAI